MSVADVTIVAPASVRTGGDVQHALRVRVADVRFVARSETAHVTVAVVTRVATALVITRFVQDAGGVDVAVVGHVAGVTRRDLFASLSVACNRENYARALGIIIDK